MGLMVKYQKQFSFHFRLLPGKINYKIFQKILKGSFRDHLGFFVQIWAKLSFPGKRADF